MAAPMVRLRRFRPFKCRGVNGSNRRILAPKTGEKRMRRREFAKLVTATVAWPMVASAQKAMPVIGFLGGASPGPHAPFVAAFHQGLSETGYVEGQNVAIEYHWAEGQY